MSGGSSGDGSASVPLSFDREADAVYLHLHPAISPDAVSRTVTLDVHGDGVDVFLELDASGRVLGIELLHASAVLPSAVLRSLRGPGDAA